MRIITTLAYAVIGVLALVAMLPIINLFLGDAYSAIDNATNMLYGDITKMVLGMIGLVLVLGLIMALYKNLTTRDINYLPPPRY